MEWWHIYLFTRLDSVGNASCALMIISGLVLLAGVSGNIVCHGGRSTCEVGGGYYKDWTAWLTIRNRLITCTLVPFILFLLVVVMLPTQKEMAAIVLLPKMANSETAQELSNVPKDVSKILRLKLEQYISDLEQPKPKSEVKKEK